MLKNIFFCVSFFVSANVYAASYNCARAQSSIEKMICANPQLSLLDEKLAADYKTAAKATQSKDMVLEQRKWISEVRNLCMDTACLVREYKARDKVLLSMAAPEPCSVKEQDLLVHWKRSKNGDFEEFLLSRAGGSRSFSSWLHHQPELMGKWDFKDCNLHIYQEDNDKISFDYRVLSLSKGILIIEDQENLRQIYKEIR